MTTSAGACVDDGWAARSASVTRVERSEALVEQHDVGPLQQAAGDEHQAALAFGELPAAVADHLLES